MTTELQKEVQNLHISNSWIKSFGACNCIFSNIRHFTIKESTKAVIIEITATQHTKSVIRIVQELLKHPQSGKRNKGASKIG